MHPLVSRIHPGLRTAFIAFLLARAAVWLGLNAGGKLHIATSDAGAPLYGAMTSAIGNPYVVAGLAEGLLLAGAVAIYQFARRDGMPQTADRATWLWIASPAMAFATPGSDFVLAYALVALAMGAILRPVWSALTLSVAVAMRPEAIIVWPALAWAWWAYREDDVLDRMVLAVLPAASFAVTVLSGVFVGEPGALFEGTSGWRQELVWNGFWHHADDLIVGGLLLCALAVALSMWKQTPRSWLWVTLPVLLLIASHDPIVAGVAVLPFAVPFFVQLAKYAQDVGFERTILSASLVALTLLAAT